MSRIGKAPISIPEGVKISVSKTNMVLVEGPNHSLSRQIDPDLEVKVEGNTIFVNRPTDQKRHRAMHGLYRTLINNMVVGVSKGYEIEQEVVGVGYKISSEGQMLNMSIGYSHDIVLIIPEEVKVTTETVKGKNPLIRLQSYDKELIGMVAAKIRGLRQPEPYKGKGIRFKNEVIRRKAGKTASAK